MSSKSELMLAVFIPLVLGGILLFFSMGALWALHLGTVAAPMETIVKCASINILVFLFFMTSFLASLAFCGKDMNRDTREFSRASAWATGFLSLFAFCLVLGHHFYFAKMGVI